MTLGVHMMIGAAVARRLASSHPLLAFAIGIATHYVSDAIPHWDYGIASFPEADQREKRQWRFTGGAFKKDLLHIALDGALGAALVLLVARAASGAALLPLLLAACGAILPDLLQGIYFATRAPYLVPLQKFHDFCHTKIKLGPYPLIGIPLQLLVALAAAYILSF